MAIGQPIKCAAAFGGRLDHHIATVIGASLSSHEAVRFRAGDELVYRVRAQLEPFGELTDGEGIAVRGRCAGQEELVLLRLEASVSSGRLGESEKSSHLIPKVGQRPELSARERFPSGS